MPIAARSLRISFRLRPACKCERSAAPGNQAGVISIQALAERSVDWVWRDYRSRVGCAEPSSVQLTARRQSAAAARPASPISERLLPVSPCGRQFGQATTHWRQQERRHGLFGWHDYAFGAAGKLAAAIEAQTRLAQHLFGNMGSSLRFTPQNHRRSSLRCRNCSTCSNLRMERSNVEAMK